MPDIVDPQVIKFVNEQIRPMSERLVALDASIEAMLATYFVNVNPILVGSASSDPIEDGRAPQGVSRLELADVQALVAQLQTIQTQFLGAGVKDVLTKPNVRTLNL